MSIEKAIVEGRTTSMEEKIESARNSAKTYKVPGETILYTKVEQDHTRGAHRVVCAVKRADGYCIDINGKTVASSRSLKDCATQAYTKNQIGYFEFVRITEGEAAAQRARKDPATWDRLKKLGRTASAY